jgi:hypothetical protein
VQIVAARPFELCTAASPQIITAQTRTALFIDLTRSRPLHAAGMIQTDLVRFARGAAASAVGTGIVANAVAITADTVTAARGAIPEHCSHASVLVAIAELQTTGIGARALTVIQAAVWDLESLAHACRPVTAIDRAGIPIVTVGILLATA